MRRFTLLLAVLAASAACSRQVRTITTDAVLGRVVIYRNGVAFYERSARVIDGRVTVLVPRERVDDFLKSLTVVDPTTRKPLAISIPRQEAEHGSYLTMSLETLERGPAEVLLTYVTESPAWKPSYRIVVGDEDKVMLEAWAIVDNVSGEDWKGVLVGVGASSALSFRYDLWSVQRIDRDLLRGDSGFAVAPPTGMSPYAGETGEELASLEAMEVRPHTGLGGRSSQDNRYAVDGEPISLQGSAPTIDPASTGQTVTVDQQYTKTIPVPGRTFETVLGAAAGSTGDGPGGSTAEGPDGTPPPPVRVGDEKLQAAAARALQQRKDVLLESVGDSTGDAQARAETVKNKLVDDGIPAQRIHIRTIVGSGQRVRVLAISPVSPEHSRAAPPAARPAMPDTPVGESHFMAERPMTVRAGTSAMVAMVQGETRGGIVYLYDPVSERGDERFAFKAVRLDNPTDDTLEPGPVTVYGAGRFIGEGITEAVPPKASVVVPFALDRQIIVTTSETEADQIAKLVSVQRGIVTAEVQHRRIQHFTLTSRLRTPTRIYLRHRLESGWSLVESPPKHMTVGDSKLFEVELGPTETRTITIAAAQPVERQLDLSAEHPLEMMKLFVDEPAASPKLRGQIATLLATHRDAVDLVDRIATLRDQLGEYRQRTSELHAQLVTLKAVRTGGDLMAQLRSRLAEMNDRTQKATLAVVDAQEKLMLTRVKFQNQLADLRLTDITEPVSQR